MRVFLVAFFAYVLSVVPQSAFAQVNELMPDFVIEKVEELSKLAKTQITDDNRDKYLNKIVKVDMDLFEAFNATRDSDVADALVFEIDPNVSKHLEETKSKFPDDASLSVTLYFIIVMNEEGTKPEAMVKRVRVCRK